MRPSLCVTSLQLAYPTSRLCDAVTIGTTTTTTGSNASHTQFFAMRDGSDRLIGPAEIRLDRRYAFDHCQWMLVPSLPPLSPCFVDALPSPLLNCNQLSAS